MRSTALDALDDLHAAADTIESMGGEVSTTFSRTRARWRDLRAADHDPLAGVVDALTGESEPDLADLATQAAAARTWYAAAGDTQAQARAWQDLATRLLPAQRAEWATTTARNYNTAADAYSQAAGALVAALELVPADSLAEALMDAPAKTRQAWADTPALAARVDQAAQFLTMAASQAGVRVSDEATALGLVAQIPDNADRRAVWTALDGPHGRAGRWGTLHRLGATLRAASAPAEVKGYRRPKPLETRYLQTGTGLLPVEYDPETDTPKGALAAGGTVWNTGSAAWSL